MTLDPQALQQPQPQPQPQRYTLIDHSQRMYRIVAFPRDKHGVMPDFEPLTCLVVAPDSVTAIRKLISHMNALINNEAVTVVALELVTLEAIAATDINMIVG